MKSEDSLNIFERFLNWFFPKKLYDPFSKNIDEDIEIEKKLEILREYIKINKELDLLGDKYIKNSDDDDYIDFS